jgi:hypothetical protein
MNAATTPISKCRNHLVREVAAKCMGCSQWFCRECVTRLERKMYCADCLNQRIHKPAQKKRDWYLVSTGIQLLLGLGGLWFTAYLTGKILVKIPSSFHEGTFWQTLSKSR